MITVTDLFCGAGGSGLGATSVPGVELRMAANHWALAIETHAANFPGVDHDVADISQVDPRCAMPDRYVCFACRRPIAVRPSGQLYPHGHRLLPGGPSSHDTDDTAWRQPRDARRIRTLSTTLGGVL